MARFPVRSPLPVLVLAGCVAGAVVFASAPPQDPEPAGLVKIPAGNVVVGLSEKDAMPRIREARTPDNRWVLAGEVGQHTAYLEDFWIAPTHVTNEMYLEFVRATGARPPATWAKLTKEEIERIVLAGKTQDPSYRWDEETQGRWWEKHWQDPEVKWEMPAPLALEPVVFVTWADAVAYCTWAGLRLPTEEELLRAGRGDEFQEYPFGKEFDRALVAHNGTTPSGLAFKRMPVAMLAGNVSRFGVHDLVGNVWSWTDSAYLPFAEFPGRLTVEVKGAGGKTEKASVIPNWDGSRKVLKGGNFSSDAEFCRLDVRVGCDPTAAVSIVGFRVASSGRPAADAAALRARAVRSSVLGFSPDRDLDRARVLGLERRSWPDMAAIAAARQPPTQHGFTAPELPPAYRVFGPCEVLAVIPLKDPFGRDDYPDPKTLEKNGLRDLSFPTLGVLTTTVALAEPALEPGSYVLAWMPAFKDKDLLELGAHIPEKDMPKTPVEPDEAKVKRAAVAGLLLLPDQEHVLFLDQDGNAAAAVPVVQRDGELSLDTEKRMRHDLELDLEKLRWDFRLKLPGRTNKAYGLRFAIKPADPAHLGEQHWTGEFAVKRPPPGANQQVSPGAR